MSCECSLHCCLRRLPHVKRRRAGRVGPCMMERRWLEVDDGDILNID